MFRTQLVGTLAEIAGNALPTSSEKMNTDLTAYVVGKAVDALFDPVAKEEADIGSNPLVRTTDNLKKVFSRK